MTAFPNPTLYDIYDRDDLGNIWEAARVAGVKPGTIRVWESRGKIERMPLGDEDPIYHLPTIRRASQVKAGRRPKAA